MFQQSSGILNAKELRDVDYRKPILGDFDRQLTILKRNFIAGKETYDWSQPYTRPPVPTPPAPLLVEEETRSEVSTIEPEPDTFTIIRKSLAIPTTKTTTLHLLSFGSGRRSEAHGLACPRFHSIRAAEPLLPGVDAKRTVVENHCLV